MTDGYSILTAGGSSLDAVEAAVRAMEDCPLFNAGKGSVFTHEGKNELDAAIMDGRTKKAGAVAAVTNIKNPNDSVAQRFENACADNLLTASAAAARHRRRAALVAGSRLLGGIRRRAAAFAVGSCRIVVASAAGSVEGNRCKVAASAGSVADNCYTIVAAAAASVASSRCRTAVPAVERDSLRRLAAEPRAGC